MAMAMGFHASSSFAMRRASRPCEPPLSCLWKQSCVVAIIQAKWESMFEQAFKNIDDVLWKEAGCTTELDYTEQTSWLLFLKYLNGFQKYLYQEQKAA